MARTGVIDIYLVYQFLRRLATPFEKWDAYKTAYNKVRTDNPKE